MVGDKSFQDVLKSGREVISDNAKRHMQMILDQYESGISIQLVQLQDVLPPKPVSDSFNEVNRAKQEQESVINEARQAYNKEIYKVEGQTQKMLTEAEGYAVERVNNAVGDASLYESILVEYSKYPQITKDRLYIETMAIVFSNNKNKIIVDKDIENLVPFLEKNNIRTK
jgi:membrane protease subunit HflK